MKVPHSTPHPCPEPPPAPVNDLRVWLLFGFNLLLVLVAFGFAKGTYHHLPAHYPVHFDIHGQPNRWVNGDSPEWFLVPGIGLLITAVLSGLAFGIQKIPLRYWNIPNKERFLALPRAAQVPLIRSMTLFLHAQVTGIWFILLAIQVMLYVTAIGAGAPDIRVVLAPLALDMVVSLVWTLRILALTRRATGD